jgi:hypothetical protein
MIGLAKLLIGVIRGQISITFKRSNGSFGHN